MDGEQGDPQLFTKVDLGLYSMKLISSVVGCTDLSGKEVHRQVRGDITEPMVSTLVSTLTQNWLAH